MVRRRYNSELLSIVAVLTCAALGGTYFYWKGEEPVPVVVADCDMEAGPIDLGHMHASTIKRHEIPQWLSISKEAADRPKRHWRSVLVHNIDDMKDGRTDRTIKAGSVMYQSVHSRNNSSRRSDFFAHTAGASSQTVGTGPIAVRQDPFDGHLFKGADLHTARSPLWY